MQSVLTDTPTTLYRTFSFDGTAGDLDNPPTVTITDPYGTDNTPAAATATGTTGEYSYLWQPTDVGDYTITWAGEKTSAAVTHRETVRVKGAHLITEDEIRTWHGNDLADTTRFPDSLLARLRDRIESEFSLILGVNVVPFLERYRRPGTGLDYLVVGCREPRSMVRAYINDTDVGVDDISIGPSDLGETVLYRPGGWAAPTYGQALWNVDVGLEAGWLEAPEAVRQSALTVVRYLIDSNQSDRVLRASDDLQTIVYATPGRVGQWYGLPMVDATLGRHRERTFI